MRSSGKQCGEPPITRIIRHFSLIAGTKVDFTLPSVGENEGIDQFAGVKSIQDSILIGC